MKKQILKTIFLEKYQMNKLISILQFHYIYFVYIHTHTLHSCSSSITSRVYFPHVNKGVERIREKNILTIVLCPRICDFFQQLFFLHFYCFSYFFCFLLLLQSYAPSLCLKVMQKEVFNWLNYANWLFYVIVAFTPTFEHLK